MPLSNWERLDQVIKWTGLSVNAFAESIGLKRAENLYQIRKGNNGISHILSESIVKKHPEINKLWLLTGEGVMLLDKSVVINRFIEGGVPFYNIDINVIDDEQLNRPLYHINVPAFHGADFAALCTSSAMSPDIPNGATVIFKACDIKDAILGETYLIVSKGFNGMRIIRRVPERDGFLRLVPKNTDDFDEFIIKKDVVKKLYAVKGVIIIKNI